MVESMKFVFILTAFFSFNTFASEACQEFKYIQQNISKLTEEDLQFVLGEPEWLDEKFKKDGRKQAGWIIGKTIVLSLLNRLSPITYLFDATRTGVSDFSGIYASNPQNYVRFLQLQPQYACGYLGLSGYNSQRLRDITHELAVEIYQLRKRR